MSYNVLLVDDDINILKLLAQVLKIDGYVTFSTQNGYEALDMLKNNSIDLIIADQKMPEISGTEVLKIVRNDYPDVTRILMTGYPDIGIFQEAVNEGEIYQIITKPIKNDIFRMSVKRALEHREVILENKRLIARLKSDVVEKAAQIIESEEKYRTLVENSMEGIMELSQEGIILFANETACKIFGLFRDELCGKPIENLFDDREEKEKIFLILEKYGKLENHVITFVLENGQKIIIQISIKSLKDNHGKIIKNIANLKDITEELKVQEQINTTKRLAAIGELAAVVAHEIKNPLGAISNSIGVLKKFLDLEDSDKKLMDIIIKETHRLNDIVNDFLSFARPNKIALERCNLTLILNDTVTILQEDNLFKDVSIKTKILGDFNEVMLDPDRMKTIFWNLLLNSAEAISGKGIIKIEVKKSKLVNVDSIEIIISDTGKGIKNEDLLTIFEPFYTNKPSGTGLGLSIVQRNIFEHGGTIEVESETNKGSQFIINLPLILE